MGGEEVAVVCFHCDCRHAISMSMPMLALISLWRCCLAPLVSHLDLGLDLISLFRVVAKLVSYVDLDLKFHLFFAVLVDADDWLSPSRSILFIA